MFAGQVISGSVVSTTVTSKLQVDTLPLSSVAVGEGRDYRYSDAHLHYVDFFQETDGMQKLLAAMDAGSIDHVMFQPNSNCVTA